MVNISCPDCGTVYKIPQEKLKNTRLKAKCRKCGTSFFIAPRHPSNDHTEPESVSSLPPSKTRYDSKPLLDSQSQKSGHDYVAITLVVVLLLALPVFGYLGFKEITRTSFLQGIQDLGNRVFRETFSVFFDNKSQTEKKSRTTPQTYRDALNAGHRYFRRQDFDKALKFYSVAQKIRPQAADPLYWRGRAFQKKGQTDEAIREFKMALEKDPEYVEAYNNLGWLYSKSKKWDLAITYLTQAIKLDPQNGWAYYNRGRCYFKLGQSDKALADAKKACDLGFELGCKVVRGHKK